MHHRAPRGGLGSAPTAAAPVQRPAPIAKDGRRTGLGLFRRPPATGRALPCHGFGSVCSAALAAGRGAQVPAVRGRHHGAHWCPCGSAHERSSAAVCARFGPRGRGRAGGRMDARGSGRRQKGIPCATAACPPRAARRAGGRPRPRTSRQPPTCPGAPALRPRGLSTWAESSPFSAPPPRQDLWLQFVGARTTNLTGKDTREVCAEAAERQRGRSSSSAT